MQGCGVEPSYEYKSAFLVSTLALASGASHASFLHERNTVEGGLKIVQYEIHIRTVYVSVGYSFLKC